MSYVLLISEQKLKDSTAINLNVDVNILIALCSTSSNTLHRA
jgi:hypothetical protein